MHPQRSPFPAPKQNMKKNHHQDKLTLERSALEGDEKLLLLQEAKGTTVSDMRAEEEEEEEEKGSSNVVAVVVVTTADAIAIAISLPRSKCEW